MGATREESGPKGLPQVQESLLGHAAQEVKASEPTDLQARHFKRANRRRDRVSTSTTAPSQTVEPNMLYFGDNLDVMREMPDAFVDLVYLDPPFNSNRIHNVLFKSPVTGEAATAQIEAFEDTWVWGNQARREYDELLRCPNTDVSDVIRSFMAHLEESDVMTYLVMMATRLYELHRLLKPNGSLYLHCDPTASHYLKVLMDAVFGAGNFLNEIVWKRTSAHNRMTRYGPVHDIIFFYAKSKDWIWNGPMIWSRRRCL